MIFMELNRNFLIFSLILQILFLPNVRLYSKFTNVQCEDHDLKFSHFQECNLKVQRRGLVTLNIHVKLYKLPVENVSVNLAFYKRASGYRPFLYNFTQDVCQFFSQRNRYPVMKFMFNLFLEYSNINHTCPFVDDIIIKDLIFEEKNFKVAPFPAGQYLFKLKVSAYNDLKATVSVYFSI